ncbi:MAG: NUDIX domain-containing protein [Candidatus Kaiserbacteria bacterium]|nr:NUDIX domain-containing protein [Candidatus Kaiserbacteria bacterium]
MTNNNVLKVVHEYRAFFPDINAELATLENELKKDASATSRENAFGHVTASGLVIKDNTVLLIFHNKLQKFIQPGGHIEGEATLWSASQREVEEETGMRVQLHPWHSEHNFIPLNIDIHTIPFNAKKQEAEHFHYDFTYAFTVLDETIMLQEEEVSDLKWLPLTTQFDDRLLRDASQKIVDLGIS